MNIVIDYFNKCVFVDSKFAWKLYSCCCVFIQLTIIDCVYSIKYIIDNKYR